MNHDHDPGFEPATPEQIEEWVLDVKKVPYGRDNLTMRFMIDYAEEKIRAAEGQFEAWDTVEIPQPKRDAKGNYVVQDGLVVTELKRVSKAAQAMVPLIKTRDEHRERLRQHFRGYPGPTAIVRRSRELSEALKAEFGDSQAADAIERQERTDFWNQYKTDRGWLSP